MSKPIGISYDPNHLIAVMDDGTVFINSRRDGNGEWRKGTPLPNTLAASRKKVEETTKNNSERNP